MMVSFSRNMLEPSEVGETKAIGLFLGTNVKILNVRCSGALTFKGTKVSLLPSSENEDQTK